MSQEENKPKITPSPIPVEKVIRIEEVKNYSERIGDVIIKGERQYAKPFINDIIKPTETENTPQTPTTPNTTE